MSTTHVNKYQCQREFAASPTVVVTLSRGLRACPTREPWPGQTITESCRPPPPQARLQSLPGPLGLCTACRHLPQPRSRIQNPPPMVLGQHCRRPLCLPSPSLPARPPEKGELCGGQTPSLGSLHGHHRAVTVWDASDRDASGLKPFLMKAPGQPKSLDTCHESALFRGPVPSSVGDGEP